MAAAKEAAERELAELEQRLADKEREAGEEMRRKREAFMAEVSSPFIPSDGACDCLGELSKLHNLFPRH